MPSFTLADILAKSDTLQAQSADWLVLDHCLYQLIRPAVDAYTSGDISATAFLTMLVDITVDDPSTQLRSV